MPSPSVVYVVVAPAPGSFWTWATISARMVRHLHPETPIILATDRQTQTALSDHDHPLLKAVDRVVVSDAADADIRTRSRRVKTAIRQLVDGDLLFLDADTVPIEPFLDLADTPADFAAVPEAGTLRLIEKWYPGACAELGWGCPTEHYFNSGVFLLRDTEVGRRLGAEWAARWERWSDHDKSGKNADQPALNAALVDLGVSVSHLSERYNVMIGLNSRVSVPDPRIFHFFASKGAMPQGSLLHQLTVHFDRTGEIDWRAIAAARARKSPWTQSPLRIRLAMLVRGVRRYLARHTRAPAR